MSSGLRRRGPTPRTVLAIASLGAAVAFVDATIVNIAFPNIERSFHGTSISTLSWVLNAYNIVFAAFLVAAGRIADLLGRRRVFVFGLEVFTLASILCAVAPSPAALIGFRVFQALGAAFLVPSSLALVLNAFPPERRSHGVALLSAVGAAAAGLGPSLGGLLVAAANWRLVFLVNVPIGIAAVWLARRHLVESRTPGRRRMPDLLGALLFALSIAALILGVVKGQEWGWGSARIVASFGVAAGLGAAFIWRSMSHPSPIIDLSLLRVRTFSVANAMTIIAAAGFYGYTLVNVLFLTGVWGYSVLQAGLALTIGPVVAVIVAGPSSRLVQRVGHRPVLVVGGLFWGGAVLWFVERMSAAPDFTGLWLPGMVLLGIGAGTLFPNLSAAAVASAPGESFATATAMNSVARQVGAALGVALVVAILGNPSPLDAVTAFHHAWTFGAVCLCVAGIGGLFVAHLEVARAPALGEAARAVFRLPVLAGAQAAPAPRARRAITMPPSTHASRSQSTAGFLATVPLFSGLPPELHAAVAERARVVQLGPGEWLFHEGDPGDALFVVRTGRLEVVDEATQRMIRELGRGDALGELALLTDMPRSASVRAVRASDLLAVSREDFENLLGSSSALALALNRTLAGQLRDARTPAPTMRPRPATVALVWLDGRSPDGDIGPALTAALQAHLSCVLLDGSQVRLEAPYEAPSAVYAPLLDQAEAQHDLVLLWAGSISSPTPWTEFCLQQADRIMALTRGGEVPAALSGRLEFRGCDLVAHDVTPGALGGWAEVLEPIESHVLRSETLDSDIQRMARRLSGRSVGLVLSGGGARAFSHIGVLDELSAAGVMIDRVAGVSMGAFIGALYAMGLDPEEIDAVCFDEWVQRRPLGDYTFPRHSLIRGERFRAMLQRTFGSALIEELPRSFMCGYSELRSGSLVLARHGPLWERVGFSLCLPVIAPPQVRGRDMYIDGSLVDNLPVQAMADLAEGPIIAVDVKASLDPPAAAQGDGARPRRRERPPSLGETLARVLLLGSSNTSESARRHADLVIKPRAEGVGLLEFHQLDAAREAGRVAAREALESAASLV
ncbi:MAG TPA: MFS transporter [Solirubrobacteraceae bacterium]|nr:MFS transporter [Solirubrobacteraceae bacterium]